MNACPADELLAAYVAGACAGPEGARIADHARTCASCSSWLEQATDDERYLIEVREARAERRRSEAAPTEPPDGIPGYRLLRELGEGGMGVVWEAEQQQPRRRVALKLIRPGLATRRALRRFAHEAEVLARLQHPGIAQIFAAGTFDGGHGRSRQPFFAMELLHGRTLLDHAQQQRLDARARIELFIAVCEAVHHAHQKGVLHRDLKPANILVDESGQPKVLDFGVARLLDASARDEPAGEDALRTMSGQIVGTLPYMSPEQVGALGGDGVRDLDVRSDVYTLGVVLYELLAGRLPYAPRTGTVHERAKMIAEEPPLRLGAVDPALRGDLETIAGKALQKDRERRYQSALELGQDLRRFLRREPISARPPSAVYQLAMFARRHRGLVTAALVVLIVLIGGIVATWRQAVRVERQRREAVAARDFLQEVLIQASPLGYGGKEPSMRRVLEVALERVDRHLMAEPGAEAGVRHTLGRVQRELGLAADARVQLERAAELYAGPARDDVQLMFVLADLCGALVKLGELDAAERAIQRALALRPALGVRHDFILGHAAGSLAVAQYVQGRLAEAEQSCRESLAAYERLAGDLRDVNVAEAKGLLALVVQGRGRRDESDRLYRESIAGLRAAGARNSVLAITLGNFAGLLRDHGALAEALAARREALAITTEVVGADHADAAFARKEVGLLLFESGEREVGLQMVRDALAVQRRALGEHPRVVQTLVQLAELTGAHDDPGGAEAHLRDALAIARRKLGERHFLTVRAGAALGGALADAGRSEEAIALLEGALAIGRSDFADRVGEIARTGAALARALCAEQRFADAERQLAAVAGEFDRRGLDAGHAARRTVLEALAGVYDAWQRPDEARRVRDSLARD